jgi:hypothetical protein
MMEWCVLCSDVADAKTALCGKCRFCSNCLLEYQNSEEVLFCLCPSPLPLNKEGLKVELTLKEVYDEITLLKEGYSEATKTLEKTRELLSNSLLKAEIITGLNYSFNYLSVEIRQRICERLLEDYTKANSNYFKFLEEVRDNCITASGVYQRLIEEFEKLSVTRIDPEKINSWYSKTQNFEFSIDLSSDIRPTHTFFYYREMSYVNIDSIGLIGQIYDEKTKTGFKSASSGHLSYWKEGKLHGRKQIFSRDTITDFYYEDGQMKTRVEMSFVSDGTKRTKITHTVIRKYRYVYFKETGDYIEFENLDDSDNREGLCFYRKSRDKRSGIYSADHFISNIE